VTRLPLLLRALPLFAALALLPTALPAQDLHCDPGDVEVRRIAFEGNSSFRSGQLMDAIATTPSSWSRRAGLPFGSRRCLDPVELQRDVLRLQLFYRLRGFYATAVDTVVTSRGAGVADVGFHINEGPPAILTEIEVVGLDTIPGGERLIRLLKSLEGRPFNRLRFVAAVDTVVDRLRNMGYARAEPLRSFSVDEVTNTATGSVQFLTGRAARIGSIAIDVRALNGGEAEISPQTVRSLITLREGELYRERDFFRSQRDLYQLETYRAVDIRLAPESMQPPGDSLLDVQVRLLEGPMRSVRVGAGWATLDCIRMQGRLTHRNFLGEARRLELNARVSKVGVGYPLAGAEGLCRREVRDDPYSDTLNYYAGATFRQQSLFGPRNVPSLTLYSERRSEYLAYLRSIPFGGVASITREQAFRTPVTVSYQIEYGKTVAEPAVFCTAFNVCDLDDIAGLNNVVNRLAVVSLGVVRNRSDNAFDPRSGHQLRGEMRHASTLVGSDEKLQFNKLEGSASYYVPIGESSVLAARLQGGTVFGKGLVVGTDATNRFVPPQERLYAGGPSSVRGFPQNQLGPVVYIVGDTIRVAVPGSPADSILVPAAGDPLRVSPSGGDVMVLGNLELRGPAPLLGDILQYALFVDFGQVWNRSTQQIAITDLRFTPGAGFRVASPVGPVRVDVAYNGYPRRPGAAYFEVVEGEERRLQCVSPGRGPVEIASVGGASCPATYTPPLDGGLFSRLTFHFSIGQAF
jgi:outer membrane protein insertion porin family